MPEQVLYRADGGHPIGMGHIMRGLRVGAELRRRQVEVVFVTTPNAASLDHLHRAGFVTRLLPAGLSEEAEARALASYVKELGTRVVVVDRLDTSTAVMRALRETGARLASLDDLGPGRLEAHLLINILVEEPEAEAVRQRGIRLLEGPAYATVSPDEAAADPRPTPEVAKHILVTLGGADDKGLTVKVADALALIPEPLTGTFVAGPAFAHADELARKLRNASYAHCLNRNVPSLLPLLRGSDLAVVAGGLTMFEAALTGTPAIAVSQPVAHQRGLAGRLQQAGVLWHAGVGTELSSDRLAGLIRRLMNDRSARQAMAERGPRLVDGGGAGRVAEALQSLLA
jgi:spore coat polysaccharide biosynthesis predicted glycosyltransferase SpsG